MKKREKNGECNTYNIFDDVIKNILADDHILNDETIKATGNIENWKIYAGYITK